MILTQIQLDELPTILAGYRDRLTAMAPDALAAFDHIAATLDLVPQGYDLPEHRAAAVALIRSFGVETLDEDPAESFSWDGRHIRTRTEASVAIHELAHWLVAPPERRGLYDFGLGAGPESGRRDEADAQLAASLEQRILEEELSSLLGILWEAELGQPAILAFLEQNWLEGWDRPAAQELFVRTLGDLRQRGLVGADGRPVPAHAIAA